MTIKHQVDNRFEYVYGSHLKEKPKIYGPPFWQNIAFQWKAVTTEKLKARNNIIEWLCDAYRFLALSRKNYTQLNWENNLGYKEHTKPLATSSLPSKNEYSHS